MHLSATPATPSEARFRAAVWKTLLASPFGLRPSHWSRACVVVAPEGLRAVHRFALAEDLRAADLGALSHECTARRVAQGEVLVLLEVDAKEIAGVHFVVLELVPAKRRR